MTRSCLGEEGFAVVSPPLASGLRVWSTITGKAGQWEVHGVKIVRLELLTSINLSGIGPRGGTELQY